MKRLGPLSCALLVALVGCETKTPEIDDRSKEVDRIFSDWDSIDTPGLAVSVVDRGRVVHTRGYGAANLEYDVPISPTTVFHVASISKQFTAMAIALLDRSGKLSLDDAAGKHLPELPDFGEQITLRQMVHHISGLRDQWQLLAIAGWRLDDVITRDQILKVVSRQKELNFAPGEKYLYCNTGFTLLAETVSRVTGQSFREWTASNIFGPLGMTNTHFHDDHETIVKNRAYSYSGNDRDGYRKSVLSYANVGATSLFTTAEDMVRWASNFEDPRVGDADLLSRMTSRAVLSSGKEIDYGMGLAIGSYRGLPTYGHGGADAGFRSYFLRFPKQDFSVALLSNLASMDTRALAYKVADLYLNDQMAPRSAVNPTARKKFELPFKLIGEYKGDYLLSDGRLLQLLSNDGKLFAKSMGQPAREVFAEDENRLYLKDAPVDFTVHRGDRGQVSHLEVVLSGRDSERAPRVLRVTPSPELFDEYEGLYESRELETFYRLVSDGNQLRAVHQRHPDIQLSPGVSDQFFGNTWFFGQLKFDRNLNGQIAGFRLSGGRIRNLRFHRID